MNTVFVFLSGLTLTMVVVFFALLYLRTPLLAILTDLCGTVERARFWAAFSHVTLFLVPLALALNHQPVVGGAESPVFAISDQIESSVIGLVISVVILGMVLSWHIGRNPHLRTQKQADPPQSA